jgi:trimethylamine--corrinoid protein Co-methyltransferase
MSELEARNKNKRRSRGGSGARRAIRGKQQVTQFPYISRKVPIYDVLSQEGLEIIEYNADTILEEIGVEFREDEEALTLWKDAGADIKGTRVRMPRGYGKRVS